MNVGKETTAQLNLNLRQKNKKNIMLHIRDVNQNQVISYDICIFCYRGDVVEYADGFLPAAAVE